MVQHVVIPFISHYGYFGLFSLLVLGIVGLPIPDEILMIFTGYLVSLGKLNYLLTVFIALLGSMTGMSISFAIGYSFGHPFFEKYGRYIHVTPEKLDKVGQWFEQKGKLAVSIGYFIPGVRYLTAYLAGISQWEYKMFILFALLGGLFWVFGFITLGIVLKEHWYVFSIILHKYLQITIILTILLTIIFFFYHWNRQKRVSED
ncbi:DedA family protein [Tepidibacillus infernus]|uniref:DedA family protein n=1 Tax=Tepidibacillus TaxID=1494427 RepID=UPI000852E3FB|nr:DedA family protein [Tepidibacillus sp. HK-1]GBF12394.1 inner membrane protein YghB [Tepidibacillus sp. HK-1]